MGPNNYSLIANKSISITFCLFSNLEFGELLKCLTFSDPELVESVLITVFSILMIFYSGKSISSSSSITITS